MTTPSVEFVRPLAWSVGPWEIILILVVLLLLFGGKKLPEMARGLAKGLKGFKDEMRDVKDAATSEPDEKKLDAEDAQSAEKDDVQQ